MKRYIIILLSGILLLGCSKPAKNGPVLAEINNYEIAQSEFEELFKESSFGLTDTQESRKQFLGKLINQKLIMNEAQRQGLDKESNFLRLIEKFWEQSLLKIALDKKSKEISGSVRIDDKGIKEAYDNMLKEGKTDKSYDQMHQQIKWELSREKESQLMNDWINQLHKKSNIKIDEDLLRQNK